MAWLAALVITSSTATALTWTPAVGARAWEYLGWFNGTVEVSATPQPGYYYVPQSAVAVGVELYTVPVRVRVQDGGSLCPSLTQYRTYLYSPVLLPGQYMYPGAGRGLIPAKPTLGWPYQPLSSLGGLAEGG
jgi:hypothetical protein